MPEKRPSPFAGLDTALLRPTKRRTDTPAEAPIAATPRPFVKATFYLEEAQVMKLEQLRLARRQRGEKVDKSALVREAIERLAAELDQEASR